MFPFLYMSPFVEADRKVPENLEIKTGVPQGSVFVADFFVLHLNDSQKNKS